MYNTRASNNVCSVNIYSRDNQIGDLFNSCNSLTPCKEYKEFDRQVIIHPLLMLFMLVESMHRCNSQMMLNE